MQQIIPKPEKNYLVMVKCFTYNQEKYIEDALKGFVMQITNFPFVAIVVDDASTDNEPKILWDFVNNELDLNSIQKDETDNYVRVVAPHKTNHNCTFVLLFLKYNHYRKKAKAPYIKEWQESAKYIALCEGDDYWTDPLKLQKQVDFLESHPDYGLVHTAHKQYIQKKNLFIDGWAKDTNIESNLINNKICTLTTCFRTNLSFDYQKEIGKHYWPMGDAPMWLFFMSKSKSKFFEEVTGVYRVLDSSASHFTDCKKEMNFILGGFDMKCYFIERLNKQYLYKIIAPQIVKELKRISYSYNENLDFNFWRFFFKYKIWNLKLFISTFATKSKAIRVFLTNNHHE